LYVVAFSTVLWAFVTFSDSFYANIYFPIEVEVEGNQYAVKSKSDKFIIVNVEAEGWLLSNYYWGKGKVLKVKIKPDKLIHTFSTNQILQENNLLPSTINVISISPSTITVKLESNAEKEVVIKPNLKIKFENGYDYVSDILVIPAKINISGIKSQIAKIDTILTAPIEFSYLNTDVNDTYSLKIPYGVNSDINSVVISFSVQKISDRIIQNVPIQIVGQRNDRELHIFPQQISVLIRGGIDIIAASKPEDIKAIINYNDAILDTNGIIVPEISTDKNFKIVNLIPDKIEYVIKN